MYYDTTIAMKYPMTAMILLAPIGWLPYVIAEKLWTIISVFSLGLGLWLLSKLLPEMTKRQWLYFGAVIILAFPYKFTLGMGQINLMILVGFIASIYAYYHDQEVWAGILIALTAWLKITPLVLLLFFWRKGKYKTIMAAGITYLLGWMIAGQIWGWELVRQFFIEVIPSLSTIGNDVYYNQALTGVIARVGINGWVGAVLNYGTLIIMLGVSYFSIPKTKVSASQEIIGFGLLIISMLMGAGLAWQHYFVWLIIPFVGLVARIRETNKISTWIISGIVMAYLLVSLNIKNPSLYTGWSTIFLSHVTFGSLLLWYLSLKIIKQQ